MRRQGNCENNQDANTIAISWTAPADDGGDSITKYTVVKRYNKADGTPAEPKMIDAGTATSITIPPAGEDALPQDVEFSFTVKAMNSKGYGPESAPPATATIDVDPTKPGMPTNLVATQTKIRIPFTLNVGCP